MKADFDFLDFQFSEFVVFAKSKFIFLPLMVFKMSGLAFEHMDTWQRTEFFKVVTNYSSFAVILESLHSLRYIYNLAYKFIEFEGVSKPDLRYFSIKPFLVLKLD